MIFDDERGLVDGDESYAFKRTHSNGQRGGLSILNSPST